MYHNVNSEAQKQVFDVLFQRNEKQAAMNRSHKSIISDTDIDDSYILNEISKLPEPSELWDDEAPQESNSACAQRYVTRDVSDAAKQGVSWKQEYNDDEIRNEGKLTQYMKIDASIYSETQQLLENLKQHPVHDAEHSKMQGTSFSHNTHASYPASCLPSTSRFHKTSEVVWGQKFQQSAQQDNSIGKPFQKVNVESESRHLSALAKKREVCRNNARLLKNQLNSLKVQRNDLRGNGIRSPSPETMNFLKENTKMQLEIQKKLKAIDKVVKMLNGIIAEEPTATRSTELTAQPRAPNKKQYQYNYVHYDPEMYWCHLCDEFPQTAKEYLDHLHTAKHRTNAAGHSETPWNILSGLDEGFPTLPSAPSKRTPIKGLQFFVPSMAWFCKLCKHFMGDLQCASTHLKSVIHTRNYNAFIEHNPHWETDWMSDRQKAFEKSRSKKLDDLDLSASPTKTKKKRKHGNKPASSEQAIYVSSTSGSDSDGGPRAKTGKHDKDRLTVDTSDYLERGDRRMVENLQIKVKLDQLAESERHGTDSSSRDVSVARDTSRDRSRDSLHTKQDRTVPRDRPDDRRDRRDDRDRRYEQRRDDRDRRYDDRNRRYDSRSDDRDRRYDDRRDSRNRRYDDRRMSRHDGRQDDWRSRHDDRFDTRRSPNRGHSVDNERAREVDRESEDRRGKLEKMDLNKMIIIGKMPSLQHAAVAQKKAQEQKEEENKKQDEIQQNVDKWKEKVEDQMRQEREKDEKEIQELAAALLANPYLFPPVPVPVPPSEVTPDMNPQELYPGLNIGFPFPPGMMAPGMGPMMNPGGMPGMMPHFPGQGLLGPGPMMPFGMNQPFMPRLRMPVYNNPRGANKQKRNQNNRNDQKNNEIDTQNTQPNQKQDEKQNNNNNKNQEIKPNSDQDRNKKHDPTEVDIYQKEIKNDENEEKIDRNHQNTNLNMQEQNENKQYDDPVSEQKIINSLREEKLNASIDSPEKNDQKTINEPNEQTDGIGNEKINAENLKEERIMPENQHNTDSISNQSNENIIKDEHNNED